MKYDSLLDEATRNDVTVYDCVVFEGNLKGLYVDGNIALSNQIETTSEKACVLAEELGHYHTSFGDITDLSNISNRKQELIARAWAYNKLLTLDGIISAYKHGCFSKYEMANFLDVTEDFLLEYLEHLKCKHGTHVTVGKYIVYLDPRFGVFKAL